MAFDIDQSEQPINLPIKLMNIASSSSTATPQESGDTEAYHTPNVQQTPASAYRNTRTQYFLRNRRNDTALPSVAPPHAAQPRTTQRPQEHAATPTTSQRPTRNPNEWRRRL